MSKSYSYTKSNSYTNIVIFTRISLHVYYGNKSFLPNKVLFFLVFYQLRTWKQVFILVSIKDVEQSDWEFDHNRMVHNNKRHTCTQPFSDFSEFKFSMFLFLLLPHWPTLTFCWQIIWNSTFWRWKQLEYIPSAFFLSIPQFLHNFTSFFFISFSLRKNNGLFSFPKLILSPYLLLLHHHWRTLYTSLQFLFPLKNNMIFLF